MKMIMKTKLYPMKRSLLNSLRRKNAHVFIFIEPTKLHLLYWIKDIYICFSNIEMMYYLKDLKQLMIIGFNEETKESLRWTIYVDKNKEEQLLSNIEEIMNIKIIQV